MGDYDPFRTPLSAAWHWIALLVALRLLTGGWFSLHMPPFTRFDELNHYHVAHFVAHEARLPQAADFPDVPLIYRKYVQFDQPPLYYLMIAPAIRWGSPAHLDDIQPIPMPLCDDLPVTHYVTAPVTPSDGGGSNLRGAAAGRAVNLVIHALAVITVWYAAQMIVPHKLHYAWIASLTYVLFPAMNELSAWINNDTPLVLIGGLFTLGLLWAIQRPTLVAWGAVIAAALAAIASKLTGVGAMIAAGVIAVWQIGGHIPRRSARLLIALGVLVGGLVLVFAVNGVLCGRWLCRTHNTQPPFRTLDEFTATLRLPYYLDAAAHLVQSMTVPHVSAAYSPHPMWVAALAMGIAVGVIALADWLRCHPQRGAGVTALLVMVGSAAVLPVVRVWWLEVGYMAFRYYALVFVPLSVLLGVGFGWLIERGRAPVTYVWLAGLALTTLLAPLITYRPLQELPERRATLPADAIITPDMEHNGIAVAAYSAHADGVTLYLTPTQPLNEPLYLFVAARSADGHWIDQCGQIAGSAVWASHQWRVGTFVVQHFPLDLRHRAPTAFEVRAYRITTQFPAAGYDPEQLVAAFALPSFATSLTKH